MKLLFDFASHRSIHINVFIDAKLRAMISVCLKTVAISQFYFASEAKNKRREIESHVAKNEQWTWAFEIGRLRTPLIALKYSHTDALTSGRDYKPLAIFQNRFSVFEDWRWRFSFQLVRNFHLPNAFAINSASFSMENWNQWICVLTLIV